MGITTRPILVASKRHKGIKIFSTGAIVLGSIMAAGAAHAQPEGCSGNSTTISQNGNTKSIKGRTSSYCDTIGSRTIVVEIKWDKNFLPDPLVAKNSSTWTGNERSVKVSTCDSGNMRKYYARGYFTTNTTHYDSNKVEYTSCK